MFLLLLEFYSMFEMTTKFGEIEIVPFIQSPSRWIEKFQMKHFSISLLLNLKIEKYFLAKFPFGKYLEEYFNAFIFFWKWCTREEFGWWIATGESWIR